MPSGTPTSSEGESVPRPPTMHDVARAAAVSLKTVSRVVNAEANVAPAMRERVELAIANLGYTPNIAARIIRPGQRSLMVGLVIEDIGNPFYSGLARAVEEVCHRAGYLVVMASGEEEGSRYDEVVGRLLERRVDGLIVVPPHGPVAAEPSNRWLPAVVFVDRPGWGSGDTVLTDHRGGARDGTVCLLRAGASQVAFVGDSLELFTMRERLAGYTDALTLEGRPPVPEHVLTGHRDAGAAAAAVLGLMSTRPEVDAVLAANNRATLGCLRAFADAGHRLRLVGFDDFEAATLVQPRVTVVAHDVAELGRRAAHLLLRRMNGWDGPTETQLLRTTLSVRGSESAP